MDTWLIVVSWCAATSSGTLFRMRLSSERQARASRPSHMSIEPTTRSEMASWMTIPPVSRGKRRKRIPQSSMLRPMLESLASRCSKDPWDKSLWQVSQEERCRCCQHKHCSQAGQIVPGIEQSSASQQSSFMTSPFQKVCCSSDRWSCPSPAQSIAHVRSASILLPLSCK